MKYLAAHARQIGLSLALVLVFLLNAVGQIEVGFLQRLENYAYDLRLLWTMPDTQDRRIVIVDIDEKSLAAEGHWPWSRNKLAKLVDQLFAHYQIKVLGFDMVFAERDGSSGLTNLEALAESDFPDSSAFQAALSKLRPRLDYDRIFSESLKNRPVALGYYFRHEARPSQGVGELPDPVLPAGSFDPERVGAVRASGFSANLPELQHNALAGGYFNASPLVDSDGVFRRVSLLQMYDGALHESLALAVARLALQSPAIGLGYADAEETVHSLEFLSLGQLRIPADIDVAALIPYRGRQGSFPYVSATEVLRGEIAPEILQGAIVLIGTTAPGLMDLRSTPVQDVYPGVEVHANLIAGILDSKIKQQPAYTIAVEVVLMCMIGVVLALLLPALSPFWAMFCTLLAMAAFTAFNLSLWQSANLVLPIAATLSLMALLFVLNTTYGFFFVTRSKRQLAGLFGQYVPPELVDEMAADPKAIDIEGDSRQMTVLFSDVRGFTTISESLEPHQLSKLMNEYLTPMTQVIHHHRGTIDKYMGDAIMAFWGAPMPDEDHARHALLTAMEMLEALEKMQPQFAAKGWPPIRIGIGINTGNMTVGNMGSEFRMAYTVMGDAVNLGSRIEGLTKMYGVAIIVSESTRAAVPDFLYRELDRVRVNNRDEPVTLFEPLCPQSAADQTLLDEIALYHDALTLYRAQDWDAAQHAFLALQKQYPARYLYDMYAQRVEQFRNSPPGEDWDGVFTFKNK